MAKPRQIFTEREIGLIIELYQQGSIDSQVAAAMGYKRTAWEKMLTYTPYGDGTLADRVREAKQSPNSKVEASLFKRANGFYYVEKEVILSGKDKGRIKETTKYALPDTVAGIFYLKNRAPERWRDQTSVKVEGLPQIFQQDPAEQVADGKD